MSLQKRINAFIKLGEFLNQFESNIKNESLTKLNLVYYNDFNELINRQKAYNGWFERENVIKMIGNISKFLQKESLINWIAKYDIEEKNKIIGVIMAGNIPLVGFHDFLSVLITGNTIKAKLSSDDKTLLPKFAEILIFIDSYFKNKIFFVDKIENIDAIIATGNNNSSRYFNYYFGKSPNIIRKNRNSIGIITERDSDESLKLLGNDIFDYFGLGCRNVSKLMVPKNYNFDLFFNAIYSDFQNVINNNKYANNYDYNKTIYLMGNQKLLDNGFVLLKEDKKLTSPVGVLHYEYYNSNDDLHQKLELQQEEIQCIVSQQKINLKYFNFGKSQQPKLSDYADNIDTIKFLNSLN